MRSLGPILCTCALLLTACATSATKKTEPQWLAASPTLKQQIDDHIARLPWTHGMERIEQIQWFAGVGEPAYEDLLELCKDPRPDVASAAVAALGATGDSRLVEPLRNLDWPASDDRSLRFEKARAFLRLGDWSSIGQLVDGLEEDSEWARAWCLQVLREATHVDFGYVPNGPAEERAVAVARWREWIASRQSEGILTEPQTR